jgi:uncharacterized protein (TIGR00266 family)
MRTSLRHNPDSGVLHVTFDHPGEQLVAEAGAMIAQDSLVELTTSVRGGLASALVQSVFGGGGLLQNTFTASAPGQSLLLAPPFEGSIASFELTGGTELCLQSGAYLASTVDVELDASWKGPKGWISSASMPLRVRGHGTVWFCAYGALHTIDLGAGSPGYVCDGSHLVGYTLGVECRTKRLDGVRGLSFGSQGLVCYLSGEGKAWLQTRNPAALAQLLHPHRPLGRPR